MKTKLRFNEVEVSTVQIELYRELCVLLNENISILKKNKQGEIMKGYIISLGIEKETGKEIYLNDFVIEAAGSEYDNVIIETYDIDKALMYDEAEDFQIVLDSFGSEYNFTVIEVDRTTIKKQ